jgi:hypothetical protein
VRVGFAGAESAPASDLLLITAQRTNWQSAETPLRHLLTLLCTSQAEVPRLKPVALLGFWPRIVRILTNQDRQVRVNPCYLLFASLNLNGQPITLPEDSRLPLPGTILVIGTHSNGMLFFTLQKGGRS